MKFQVDRKSGLDPVFGLPVARDSRAMDTARNRNFRSDKRLENSLKTIDHSMHSKILRCHKLETKTREFLTSIKPDPKKRIVCPSGLSAEQKQTVRLLRRGSMPSMTLHEFDEKLSSAKASRQTSPASDKTVAKTVDKSQLSEFKIKRKVFSRNSKKLSHSMSVPNMEACVLDSAQTTKNPLYRCKTVMDGAYQRLNSADVSHANSKESSVRFLTITELDKDGALRKGSANSLTEKSCNLSKGRGFDRKRRRILSNQTSSSDASSPSSDSSIHAEEDRFEKFLTVLRGEAMKLPEIST